MNYENGSNGRAQSEGSKGGSFHTFESVQDQLIEAMQLWRRSPGDGRWPFAGDGPWHLVRTEATAQEAWDIKRNAHDMGRSTAELPARPLPLSLEEVALRDATSEWIALAPERDRKLVALVLEHKACSDKPVKWTRIRQQLIRAGEPTITARGLGMRYSRAITAIAKALNGGFPGGWASRQFATS